VSNTDFVNSGSYFRTVFVFISGMTTFTCFGGAVGFFGSGLAAAGVGGGVGVNEGVLVGAAAVVCLAAMAVAGVGWVLMGGCVLDAGSVVLVTEGAEAGFPARWTFPDPIDAFACETAGLDMWDTVVFLAGGAVGRFAVGDGTTFLAGGLAILLAAGAFLADLLLPDEWAGLAAAFLAGAIFLTWTAFLAGLAAFFLVAIQLGFFCNKHF
jgi:hypothetical protein